MQVTERHIEDYREEGYCLVEGLIPADQVAAVRQRVEEIVEVKPCERSLGPGGFDALVDSFLRNGKASGYALRFHELDLQDVAQGFLAEGLSSEVAP